MVEYPQEAGAVDAGVRITICLDNPSGGVQPCAWRQVAPGIWFAGSAKTATSVTAADKALPTGIREMRSAEEACMALRHLPGTLGCVVTNRHFTLATPGRFRNWPLYYRQSRGGQLAIADHPERLIGSSERLQTSEVAEAEFLNAGYCTGRDTLIDGVQQLLPGEALILRAGTERIETLRYYVYPSAEPYFTEGDDLQRRLREAYHQVLTDVIDAADGRTLVLPLTGGYDSRLFALLLAERGAENVHCVTYDLGGRLWEVRTARRVAQHLGFRWSHVPLSGARWRTWYYSESFVDFQRWASGWSALPHRHEWPTAQFIRRMYDAGDGALVLSAICAGSIAGAFAWEALPGSGGDVLGVLAEDVVGKFYHLANGPSAEIRGQLVARVREGLRDLAEYVLDARELFSAWEWQERECKYIASAMRVHDWHGIPWAAPFMDGRVCDLWSRVEPAQRSKKKFHSAMVEGLRVGMPPANEPEYRRSNVRIAQRMVTNTLSFTLVDCLALWRQSKGGLRHTAKLMHGEGWHTLIALGRIMASMKSRVTDRSFVGR